MRWAPWRKEPDKASGRSDAAKTKQPRSTQDEDFLKNLTTVAQTRGYPAAEQLISVREEGLWGRLSMLAEPLDPARAVVYAERCQASVSAWIAWLEGTENSKDRTDFSVATSLQDELGDLLALLPTLDLDGQGGLERPLPSTHDRLLSKLEQTVKVKGLDAAEQLIAEHQANAWLGLSKLSESRDWDQALDYAQRAYSLYPSAIITRKVDRLLYARGDLVRSEQMFRSYLDSKAENPTAKEMQRLGFMQGWKSLFLNGFPLPAPSLSPVFDPIPDKVIYCLHNSLPLSSAGYSIRSHSLLRALQSAGVSTLGLTRYGYPWDMSANRGKFPRSEYPLEDVIEDVIYRRLPTFVAGWSQLPTDRYIQAYAEELEAVAVIERPSVIHAASNFLVGLAAVTAARRLGLPVIYEVRGLWEVTRASRDPKWIGSELWRAHVQLETQAAMAADRVITITQALKDELVRRGVPDDQITIVPNCVDADRFVPEPRDRDLEQELGLEGKQVIGYIGSFTDYEGLDDLLYATSFLVDQGIVHLHLLLVGDGLSLGRLRKLVSELELDDYVTLTGRVPFDQVHRYYSLIDIAPFPRKPVPVTEMVSPLKPFEAMAMEKAVLVSSVAALAEMVNDGTTGMVFEKGNLDSLAAAMKRLVIDPELCTRLGMNARAWVVANRSWAEAGATIADIYRDVVQARSAPLHQAISEDAQVDRELRDSYRGVRG